MDKSLILTNGRIYNKKYNNYPCVVHMPAQMVYPEYISERIRSYIFPNREPIANYVYFTTLINKGLNMKLYSLIFALIFILIIPVVLLYKHNKSIKKSIIYTILFYREYQDFFRHRVEQQAPIKLFLKNSCTDAKKVLAENLVEFCHKRSHELHEDPQEYAIYDVMETRGFCFGYSCQVFFAKVSLMGPLQFVSTLCAVVVLLLLGCGFRLTMSGIERYSRQYLPFVNKKD